MYTFQHWPTPEEAGINDQSAIDAWHERIAICIVDGQLSEQDARAVAWREVGGIGTVTEAAIPADKQPVPATTSAMDTD